MSENFDELLSGLAAAAAGATNPQGSSAARRRGKQRVMRRRLAASVVSVALVLGAAGVAVAMRGPSGVPAPVTHSDSPSPNPSADATAAAPSPSASSTTPADGAPTLSLTLPASLALGVKNPVGLAVTNPGPATTATVTVDLGIPSTQSSNSSTLIERAVLERQDPGSGTWVAIPVTELKPAELVAPVHDVATYQLVLPAHAASTEKLRFIPVGFGRASFAVHLSVSGFAAVTRSADPLLIAPTVTGTGPTSVAHGTTSGEFDFTVKNVTLADYTGIHLYLGEQGTTVACQTISFPTAQWSDGGPWHTVSLSEGLPLLDTIALGHGEKSTVIRVRLVVPATLAPCLKQGQVSLIATNMAVNDTTPGYFTVNRASLVPSFAFLGAAPPFQAQ